MKECKRLSELIADARGPSIEVDEMMRGVDDTVNSGVPDHTVGKDLINLSPGEVLRR